MRIDFFTLFPQMFNGALENSIMKRASDRGLVRFYIHNIRDYTHDRHNTADDYTYGGGAGMVMKPEPVFEAVETVRASALGATEKADSKISIVLLTPQGRLFRQSVARELVELDWLMFVCGHYEGVDERIRAHLVDDEISIGDYVLTGGELPAMVVADAVVRLVPGVLGSGQSLVSESHNAGLLEYPQYTRPEVFRKWEVPEVLLSGNHGEVAGWRRLKSVERTAKRRPDLLDKAELTDIEKEIAAKIVNN